MKQETDQTLSDSYMAEQWLLQAGVFTQPTSDTLIAYAYMAPGVENATLEVDTEKNDVLFKLTPKSRLLLRLTQYLMPKKGILPKVGLLLLAKLNAPVIAEAFLKHASLTYLPKGYNVRIEWN